MLLPFNINVNRGGIPCLRSTSVTVTTTDVRFDFNSHRNVGGPFVGLVIVQLAQPIPAGTTATLPNCIHYRNGFNPANVTTLDGANVTVGGNYGKPRGYSLFG